MDWLNLHDSTLDSPEFVGASPTERATWICLLRYCIGQENGGRIDDCEGWADRRWQQLCRVTLDEVKSTCGLWRWNNGSVEVNFYPLDKEREVKQKRAAGKSGAAKRWQNAGPANGTTPPCANGTTAKVPYAEVEVEGKGRGMEGEGEGNARTVESLGAEMGKPTAEHSAGARVAETVPEERRFRCARHGGELRRSTQDGGMYCPAEESWIGLDDGHGRCSLRLRADGAQYRAPATSGPRMAAVSAWYAARQGERWPNAPPDGLPWPKALPIGAKVEDEDAPRLRPVERVVADLVAAKGMPS